MQSPGKQSPANGTGCAARPGRTSALLVLCAVLLAACAAPRPVPDDRRAAWSERRPELEALDGWRATGRFSVRTGDESGQAGFTWSDAGGRGFRLHLDGPLGQVLGRLTVDATGALLVTRKGRQYRGDNAARLLRALYGWDIPVAGLRRWLIGLPGDSSDYRLDRFGRLASLDAGRWAIDYGRYRRVGKLELPAVLTAHRRDDDARIRIVVSDWSPDGAAAPAAPSSPVPLIGGD